MESLLGVGIVSSDFVRSVLRNADDRNDNQQFFECEAVTKVVRFYEDLHKNLTRRASFFGLPKI